jgi:hypothetical protein
LFACRRSWDLCSSRAIGLHLQCAPGLRLDGDTRVRHVPVSFPSDYSLGSLIRVHCVECLLYERHAISAQNCSDRWHPQCAASPGSRAVGSLTVGNARLATIMGIVKAISSLGLCCGLWFARALLVERTPGSDGGAKWILRALAASDRWACALIFPLELLRSCCSYDSTGRDVCLRRCVLSVPEPARSVAVVRC